MVGDLFKFILGMQLNISSSGVNFFSFLSLIFFSFTRESFYTALAFLELPM